MPTTIASLLVLLVAVLPGALYTWAFEREVGRWGVGLSDRIFRFIGVSALYLAALAYPIHLLWVRYLHVPGRAGQYQNLILEGRRLPWWLYLIPLGYVLVPIALGTLAAIAVRRSWKVARVVAGADPAPRAWDALFSVRPSAVVRARLKDNAGWVGGLFGASSYAAGYPDEPQDLFLESAYQVLNDGTFAEDAEGSFVELGSGLLVKWEDVLHLEIFLEAEEQEEEDDE